MWNSNFDCGTILETLKELHLSLLFCFVDVIMDLINVVAMELISLFKLYVAYKKQEMLEAKIRTKKQELKDKILKIGR